MQPGQSVSPGGGQQEPSWQYSPETSLPAPQPQAAEVQQAPASQPAAPLPQPAAPQAEATDLELDEASEDGAVSWTASEFIAHAKSGGWYMVLFLITAVVGAGVYLLTRSYIATGGVALAAVAFGAMGARKPRELQYIVNSRGISIGGKPYPFSGFRSFAVVQEEGIESILFMPLKRFMPIVSIYFDPKDGDKIVDILAQYLPFEARGLDFVDRLMHRIGF